MRARIDPKWLDKQQATINEIIKLRNTFECPVIDHTSSFNLATQWLVVKLSTAGIPFKLYNLGAGVKRVTTDTTTCPCCKRAL